MTGRDVDLELLGRLAERMEEAGRGFKAISVQQVEISNQLSSLQTSVDGVNARLKRLETTINGNGHHGLKTEVELLKQRVKTAETGIGAVSTWRESLSAEKVRDLKDERKEHKASRGPSFWLTLAAVVISLGSMLATCGPQWQKAWAKDQTGPVDHD